jgi:hypothetical protein
MRTVKIEHGGEVGAAEVIAVDDDDFAGVVGQLPVRCNGPGRPKQIRFVRLTQIETGASVTLTVHTGDVSANLLGKMMSVDEHIGYAGGSKPVHPVIEQWPASDGKKALGRGPSQRKKASPQPGREDERVDLSITGAQDHHVSPQARHEVILSALAMTKNLTDSRLAQP